MQCVLAGDAASVPGTSVCPNGPRRGRIVVDVVSVGPSAMLARRPLSGGGYHGDAYGATDFAGQSHAPSQTTHESPISVSKRPCGTSIAQASCIRAAQ